MKNQKILFPIFATLLFIASSCVQTLESGNVIGLHVWEITLNNGVTAEQFEEFVLDTYIPASNKHFEGVKLFLLKGERGKNKGDYGFIYYFESLEVRNEWIPQLGKLSEKGIEADKKLKPLDDKLYNMVTLELSLTDWVIL